MVKDSASKRVSRMTGFTFANFASPYLTNFCRSSAVRLMREDQILDLVPCRLNRHLRRDSTRLSGLASYQDCAEKVVKGHRKPTQKTGSLTLFKDLRPSKIRQVNIFNS